MPVFIRVPRLSSHFFSDYSYGSATTKYNHLNAYKEKPKTLYLSPKSEDQQEIVTLLMVLR